MKLAEIFVAVRADTTNTGAELQQQLGRIDTGPAGRAAGKKFGDGLDKSGSGAADKAGKKFATRFGVGVNGAIGSITSKSAGLFAAGFAAFQGVKAFGGFIADAEESAKVSRITANAIKATGGVAKVTADQVGDLATAISNKTGIDDEQVQSASNMLLTFKNIRNETGKNNDIFNRATQAAADLSVQFGGIDSASKQLGKALNDPVKGITALSKAGVTFTEGQKKQIKELVKTGDVLGAQKIILKEIEGQVGGAAAAASSPLAKLKVVAGNLGEEFGGILLPKVNAFATFLMQKAAPALSGLFTRIDSFTQSKGFQSFLDTVTEKARSFATFLGAEVLPRIGELASWIGGTLVPKLKEMATFVQQNSDFFKPFIIALGAIIAGLKIFAIVQAAVNLVLAANPIGLVVLALAALVAGLIWAYKNSETFRKIVDGAFKVVQAAGSLMWSGFLKPILTDLMAWLKGTWERAQQFGSLVAAGFNAIKQPAAEALKWVVGKMLTFVGSMIDAAAKAFGWVPGIGDNLKTAATEFGKFKDSVNAQLNGIKDQSLDFTIKYSDKGVNLTTPSSVGRHAAGGKITGAGTPTSDNIPALLSPTEWVIKGKSSAKYGDYAMGSVNAGTAMIIPNAFAVGGKAAPTRTPWGTTAPGSGKYSNPELKWAVKDPLLQALRMYGFGVESDWTRSSPEVLDILESLSSRRRRAKANPKADAALRRAMRLHGYERIESDWDVGSTEMREILKDFIGWQRTDPMVWAAHEMGWRGARPGMSVRSYGFGQILQGMMKQRGAPRGIGSLRYALKLHGFNPGSDSYMDSLPMKDMLGYFLGRIPGFAGGGRPGLGVNIRTPDVAQLTASVAKAVQASARPVAMRLAASNGPLQRAMSFGRSQAGKPYGWGATGPSSYDCSGFVSALVNVAQGKSPYSRVGATGSMPWGMFAPGSGRFNVGWFKGNPGHTAATINGVNFESRGGDGVVVGSGARGANSSLFTNRAKVRGFAQGGRPGEGRFGDTAFDLANPRGKHFLGRDVLRELGIPIFDGGGTLKPGFNAVYNATGGPETLARTDQDMALSAATVRAIGDAMRKAFGQALEESKFRLVSGPGGSYLLRETNG